MKKKRFSLAVKTVLATSVLLLFSSLTAHAAYEVSTITSSDVPIGTTAVQYTNDFLQVNWDNPTISNPDQGIGYVYVWNRSNTPLSLAELNRDDSTTYATNGNRIDSFDPITDIATLAKANYINDDSTDLWYLHLKTIYLAGGVTPTHSDDAVIGPFNIDNVVSGSFCLPDPDCNNPLVSTRNTQLTIQLTPPNDLEANGVYIIDAAATDPVPARPGTGVAGDTTSYSLTDTTPSDKTIYVWFQDQAGNISTAPETANFTLLPAVTIEPNTATIFLSGSATQVFTIAGTSDTQNWTISSETPVTPNDTVCSLTGDTGTTSVILTGVNPGTCVLQATSTVDSSVVTSGTITVSGTTANLDIDGDGNATALGDGVLIVRYLFGFTGNTLVNGVVDPNCTRCTATEIESYLAAAKDSILDVDGSGSATALGDGVLIVRYLFGFTGSTLINGVVDQATCTLCTANDIENNLLSLKP